MTQDEYNPKILMNIKQFLKKNGLENFMTHFITSIVIHHAPHIGG